MAREHSAELASRGPLKLSEWLRAVRARHWLHFLLLPAAGFEASLGLAPNVESQLRGFIIAFAILSFGYLINGLADREMDANTLKNPLAGELPSTSVPLAAGLLALVACALAAGGSTPALVATMLALVSGVVYSVGPRLKRLPVVGTLLNVVNFAPLLWVGVPVGGEVQGLAVLTACFSCLLLQNQLIHEASDSDDDRRGGVRSTFLLLGRVRTGIAASMLGVTLAGVLCYAQAPVTFMALCAFVYVVAFPLAFVRVGSSELPSVRKWHRLATVATGALVFLYLRSAVGN